MNEEEFEKTGIFEAVEKDHDDYISVNERIEQVEDRLEYVHFPIWKLNNIKDLIEEIKKTEDEDVQEEKFRELVQLMDD